MKMLFLIFRQSLEEDVQRLLRDLGLKGFTEAPKLLGTGEAGQVANTLQQPGFNSLIFSALEDQEADMTIAALTKFRDRLSISQNGAAIPLRVFVLPCQQVL